MSFYLNLLWHVWLAGFFVFMAIIFIRPYWLMTPEEWEEHIDHMRDDDMNMSEPQITWAICFCNIVLCVLWPITLGCYVHDRWSQ